MAEVKSNFENVVVYMPQSWDWLENKRSEDDKMFRGV